MSTAIGGHGDVDIEVPATKDYFCVVLGRFSGLKKIGKVFEVRRHRGPDGTEQVRVAENALRRAVMDDVHDWRATGAQLRKRGIAGMRLKFRPLAKVEQAG